MEVDVGLLSQATGVQIPPKSLTLTLGKIFTSLCLSLLILKMGVIVPTAWGFCVLTHKVPRTVIGTI
jgi:hypothetical protein